MFVLLAARHWVMSVMFIFISYCYFEVIFKNIYMAPLTMGIFKIKMADKK